MNLRIDEGTDTICLPVTKEGIFAILMRPNTTAVFSTVRIFEHLEM